MLSLHNDKGTLYDFLVSVFFLIYLEQRKLIRVFWVNYTCTAFTCRANDNSGAVRYYCTQRYHIAVLAGNKARECSCQGHLNSQS